MSLVRRAGGAAFNRFGASQSGPTSEVVHQALQHAVEGVGPLPGAKAAADKALSAEDGDVEKAIDRLVNVHLRLAATEGFATNVGGLVTAAWAIPANIAGLAVVQIRMVAAIAHLRGYDLDDTRVRNAVLATLLGRATVRQLVKDKKLPGSPRQIAVLPEGELTTAPATAPGKKPSRRASRTELDKVVGGQVATTLLTAVGGKRVASFAAKRVPLLGGVIGGGSDAWNTRGIGRYAREELNGAS